MRTPQKAKRSRKVKNQAVTGGKRVAKTASLAAAKLKSARIPLRDGLVASLSLERPLRGRFTGVITTPPSDSGHWLAEGTEWSKNGFRMADEIYPDRQRKVITTRVLDVDELLGRSAPTPMPAMPPESDVAPFWPVAIILGAVSVVAVLGIVFARGLL